MRNVLLSSLLLGVIAITPASAQTTGGLVTPFIGVVTDTPIKDNRTVYGGAVGVTGPVAGFELDLGYTPNFYEADDNFGELGSSGSVTTVMANLLLGVPLGRLRPYVTVGGGLMRSNLQVQDVFDDLSRNDFGVNYGGGLMLFISDNVGFRGDVRHFRSLRNEDLDDDFPEPFDFALGDFTFWRATGGLTFRF